MFVCLSSGSTPRYREDILRALAMPAGTVLQFRYDQKYLTQGVIGAVDGKQAVGQAALIVFVDKHDPAQAPSYVPCRYAKVKRVSRHGTTLSVELTLEAYAYADNLPAFNQWMTGAFPQELPTWQNGQIQGKYWLRAANESNSVVRTDDLANWQRLVDQLVGHADFSDETCFYTITSLCKVGTDKPIMPTDGAYRLGGGKAFELSLYHYHPTKTPTHTILELKLAGSGLVFTTNPIMRIDSRYDQKVIRLQVASTGIETHAFLTLVRGSEGAVLSEWQFDLPVVVKSRFWLTLGFGFAVAIFLAIPQISAVLANSNFPKDNVPLVVILTGLASLFAGLFAAFGLKKPF